MNIIENGKIRSIPFTPDRLRPVPLDFQDYRRYMASGKLRLEIEVIHTGSTFAIAFQDSLKDRQYAALVPGGWLPLAYAQGESLLLDTNIASNSPSLKSSNPTARIKAISMQAGGKKLLPTLAALEGKLRRFQSLEEMQTRLEYLCQLIDTKHPGMLVQPSKEEVQAACDMLQDFQAAAPRLESFLENVWPLLLGPDTKKSLPTFEIFNRINHERIKNGVEPSSFAFWLALDSAFSRRSLQPSRPSPGRAVLKPGQKFSSEVAYNAIADLFHLEMAVYAIATPDITFCTHDYGLVGAWALFGPHEAVPAYGRAKAKVMFTDSFAPLLGDEERYELFSLLEKEETP